MSKIVAVIAVGLMLTGCSVFKAANVATTPVGQPVATDVQKAAYEVKLGFQATLILATAYIERPRCGRPTSPVLCSQQSIVDAMRTYIAKTDAAVQAAENAARSTGPDTTIAAALVTAAAQSQDAFKAITADAK